MTLLLTLAIQLLAIGLYFFHSLLFWDERVLLSVRFAFVADDATLSRYRSVGRLLS